MHVLSLYNCATFGCFISINDKIINNLLRWGRFQPNFRRPLATKLWMRAKTVFDKKWWHGLLLSACKIWWKSRDARRRKRMKCDVFHFFYYRQDLPEAALPVLFLLTGRFWGFSPRSGYTLHRSRWNLAGGADRRSAPTCQNFVEIARRTSAWEDEVWCFFCI